MRLAAKIKVPVSTSSSDGLLGNLKSPVTPPVTECPAQDSTRVASSQWVEVAAQIGDNLLHVGRIHDGPIRGNEA